MQSTLLYIISSGPYLIAIFANLNTALRNPTTAMTPDEVPPAQYTIESTQTTSDAEKQKSK